MLVHQSGHKKRHSTETALIYVTDQNAIFESNWQTVSLLYIISIRHLMTGPEVNS